MDGVIALAAARKYAAEINGAASPWRKIAEAEISEPAAFLEITQDSHGRGFSLRRFIIYFESPQAVSTTYLFVAMPDMNGEYANLIDYIEARSDSSVFGTVECEYKAGRWNSRWTTAGGTNIIPGQVYGHFDGYRNGGAGNDQTGFPAVCTALKLTSNSGVFASGRKFEIWGCDA